MPEKKPKNQQSTARTARRKVEAAESEVHVLEARVEELTARLADPEFYADAGGADRAAQLSKDLEIARSQLERAFASWAAATEELERG